MYSNNGTYCGGRYDPYAYMTEENTKAYRKKAQASLKSWQSLDPSDMFYEDRDRAIAVLTDDLYWCDRHIENLKREKEKECSRQQKSSQTVGLVARLTNWLWRK